MRCIWDLDDDPFGNVPKVAAHGLTKEDVEQALAQGNPPTISRSSGRPMQFGFTSSGELIAVVYEWVDEETIYVVTAFSVEDT